MNLPEGWKASPEDKHGYSVLTRAGGGYITINYKIRGFDLGMCAHVPKSGNYAGAGWRDRLEADAIAALNEVYKDEK